MPPELQSLLVQAPLVIAVIWFALAMVKAQRQATEADQKRLLEHELHLQQGTHAFIAQQNSRWHELIEIERARRKEAMDQGLHEVDTMGQAITRLADAITAQAEAIARHDQAAFERHQTISKTIDEIKKTNENLRVEKLN